MKSLNDYIWNDEHLDVDLPALDCEASSTSLIGDCLGGGTIPTVMCNQPVNGMTICGTTPNPNPPTACGSIITPLIVNGCILPMGVSCGGGGVGVMTTGGCIFPAGGPGDFCAQ